MVVDDDAGVVEFFAGILVEHGATVVTAQSGEEAVRAARRERPDLVISDVAAADLDGFALCRKLKRDPVLADVPVILDLVEGGATRSFAQSCGGRQRATSRKRRRGSRCWRPCAMPWLPEAAWRSSWGRRTCAAIWKEQASCRCCAACAARDRTPASRCATPAIFSNASSVRTLGAAHPHTPSDGSFVRGEAALPQLLGASAGRYTVSVARGPLKQTFDGSLDEVLTRGASELRAQLDALSFPLLPR